MPVKISNILFSHTCIIHVQIISIKLNSCNSREDICSFLTLIIICQSILK